MKILNKLENMVAGLAFSALIPLALTSVAAQAQSAQDLSGVHRGHFQSKSDKDEIDLLVHPIADSQGSYLGILLRVEPMDLAIIYRIDPLTSGNRYAMTPLHVTPDGAIGVNNSDPSKVLTLNGQVDGGQPEMTITTANSSNTDDFNEPVDFRGGSSGTHGWVDLVAGNYYPQHDDDHKHRFISITPLNGDFESSTSMLLDTDMQGSASLEEGAPGLFALKVVKVLSTGEENAQYPKKIGFFISRDRTTKFVMVNPENDKDVYVIEQK